MAKGAVKTSQKEAAGRKAWSVKKKAMVGAEIVETQKKTTAPRILLRKRTDDAATRCVRLRLGMYPKTQVDNNVNSNMA